jgi:hypothetical protein
LGGGLVIWAWGAVAAICKNHFFVFIPYKRHAYRVMGKKKKKKKKNSSCMTRVG